MKIDTLQFYSCHHFDFRLLILLSAEVINIEIAENINRKYSDLSIMKEVIRTLKEDHVKYVLCNNQFLPHQLNYLTNKEILFIGKKFKSRTRLYLEEAWKMYLTHKNSFAIIGYNFNKRGDSIPGVTVIGDKIFYISDLNDNLINIFRFRDDAFHYMR